MADNKFIPPPPKDPWPLTPANEEILDGSRVTFAWEPVEGAREYRLQVARDSTFEDVIREETISGDTTTYGPIALPQDDQTYYWRVIVRTETGTSPGDRVESFVSSTPEQASLRMARPDDDKRMGPFPELIRSGGTEIKAELTGKQEYYDQEAAEGVEHEGVETAQITILAGTVLLIIVGLIATVMVLYNNVERTTRQMFTGISGYPELTRLREAADSTLNNYGVIDPESGIYQIPLEQAMERTVQQYGGRPASEYSRELPLLPDQQSLPTTPGPAPDSARVLSGTGAVRNVAGE